jgi:hypothetical protein
MKKYFTFLVIPVLLLTLIIPQGAQAATTSETIVRLQQIVQLYQRLLQLRIQLDELQGVSQSGSQTSELSVKTDTVQLLNNSTVKMNGQVTFKDDGDARVWFKYGSTVALSNKTQWRAIDNKDSGDSYDFSQTLNDLSRNNTYYFRAMAEDENGHVAQGVTKSFTYTSSNSSNNSNNSDNNNEPDATTGDVTDITQDEARLEGEVDMNDFNNGEVFFVYGEDEDAVDDADNENRYKDIDESGSDLRKVVVSTSFDDSDTFTKSVSNLNDDTDIYYRICVEYNDDSDDDVLICGDVESFTSDSK